MQSVYGESKSNANAYTDELKCQIVQELISNQAYACEEKEIVVDIEELEPTPVDKIIKIKRSNLIINKMG